jgi:hypothetical protein
VTSNKLDERWVDGWLADDATVWRMAMVRFFTTKY